MKACAAAAAVAAAAADTVVAVAAAKDLKRKDCVVSTMLNTNSTDVKRNLRAGAPQISNRSSKCTRGI